MADGTRKALPVGAVVRALRPNEMGTAAKLGLYLSRIREFVTEDPRESNTEGGIFPAIFGTVMMVFLMSFAVVPLGVLAAIYLREYARQGLLVRMVRIAADRSHAMASWDRGTRLPPRIHQYASEECVAGYPNGEGLTALGAVGIHGAGTAASTPVDSSWRLGGWHTVRIQILADGRCGIAIDGRPIWISPSAIPTNTPFRLWLEGNSSQTDQIIVGPVEVWRGMKTDLRWDDLGRPSPREVRRTRRRHRKPRRAPYPDLKPPRPVELR